MKYLAAFAFLLVAGCTTTPEPPAPVKRAPAVARGIAVPAAEHGQTALRCLQSTGHNERGNPTFRNACAYEVRVTYCFETSGSVSISNGSTHTFRASCNRPGRSLFSGTSFHKAGAEFRLLSRGPQRILYGVCPKEGYRTYHPRNAQKKYACTRKKS